MGKISENIINTAVSRLQNGKGIRRRLPNGGIFYMDRPLPFICVTFFNESLEELNEVDRLMQTEASYIIASLENKEEVVYLLKKIIKVLSDLYGAFLLIEFYSKTFEKKSKKISPCFEIYSPGEKPPLAAETLKKGLEKIKISNNSIRVKISPIEKKEGNLSEHFFDKEKKSLSCQVIGLSIDPFYISRYTNKVYPLLFRTFRTELSKILKKTFYDFVRVQTNQKVAHFLTLGRRGVVRAFWMVDRQIVEINNLYRFILLVTPVNTDEAWAEFKKNKFQKPPVFHYRLMPVDPELLKRRLYNIPIEKIEDPTLAYLFRDKRFEIDKELTMLAEREKKDFMYSSIQLFGGVDDDLVKTAKKILEKFPYSDGEDKDDYEHNYTPSLITADKFAERAAEEIKFFKKQHKGVKVEVEIRNDVVGLLVSKGKLLISSNLKISENRLEALIQHEVGTHILTYYNGKAQPIKLLYCGTAGYEQLQEGIAVLAEYLSDGLTNARLRILAARVIAVDNLINGADFIETFSDLKNGYNFDPLQSFLITMRVYRSGGFTKDAVYLKGFINLIKYLKNGNKLEPLLIGKIKQDYISVVQELIYRNILTPIPIKPRYLVEKKYLSRLNKIKSDANILNLLERN